MLQAFIFELRLLVKVSILQASALPKSSVRNTAHIRLIVITTYLSKSDSKDSHIAALRSARIIGDIMLLATDTRVCKFIRR